MAGTIPKTWAAEILFFADLNGNFEYFRDNALTVISPLTANLDCGGFGLLNIGFARYDEQGSSPTTGANEGAFWTAVSGTVTEGWMRGESDGTVTRFTAGGMTQLTNAGSPPDYISGLVPSNAADTDHDITLTSGRARNHDNDIDIILAASITKQIDAAWAVGTNLGGLDTGAVANNTTYRMYLIRRSDTGVVDAIFSAQLDEATGPTMPTSYDDYAGLGVYVRTDGSANIRNGTWVGDGSNPFFRYDAAIVDVNDNTITSNTAETATLSIPPDTLAHIRIKVSSNTANLPVSALVRPIGASDVTVDGASVSDVGTNDTSTTSTPEETGFAIVPVDASSQCQYVAYEASNVTTVIIHTLGYQVLGNRT